MRVGKHHGVEMAQFLPAFLGEFEVVIHLLLNMRQHVAHDDIANLFELHTCTHQFLHPQSFKLIEVFGCELGKIKLDGCMLLVDPVVEACQFVDARLIRLFVEIDNPAQHDFNCIAHADDFARCIGERLRRTIKDCIIERAILFDFKRLGGCVFV
ncbi:hypothetical protein D3C81_1758780 [compost metagenome]